MQKDLLQKRRFPNIRTGISNGINFKEIIVLNKKSGKPYISIVAKPKKLLIKSSKENLKFLYLFPMKKYSSFYNNIIMNRKK